jgi:2-polyprenyl-3-methyl-5-hydroxy-6-metoxy-1,4-benzoquinol methylase
MTTEDKVFFEKINSLYEEYLDPNEKESVFRELDRIRYLDKDKCIEGFVNAKQQQYQQIEFENLILPPRNWIPDKNVYELTEFTNSWEFFSFLNFENKVVLDIGCHTGYYCFKIMEQGAKKVIGIDVSSIDIARELSWIKQCPVIFLKRNIGGQEISIKRDWTLVMNVTHHITWRPFSYKELSYKNIFTNTNNILFELSPDLLEENDSYGELYGFKRIYKTISKRNRLILIYERIQNESEK